MTKNILFFELMMIHSLLFMNTFHQDYRWVAYLILLPILLKSYYKCLGDLEKNAKTNL